MSNNFTREEENGENAFDYTSTGMDISVVVFFIIQDLHHPIFDEPCHQFNCYMDDT